MTLALSLVARGWLALGASVAFGLLLDRAIRRTFRNDP